jgi:hypothetical protein
VSVEEFESVRSERDPLARARRATELIGIYQQRSTELARLRRVAIDEAAQARGLTFAAVAAEIGLSKGRITQIRQSAPPPERALFGVGPVRVAVPLRAIPGRSLPVISAEDTLAAELVTATLAGLGFAVQQIRIPVAGQWKPEGDVVAICGPKSSPVIADIIKADPVLEFAQIDGDWTIRDRRSGRSFRSGLDRSPPQDMDVAYLSTVARGSLRMTIIAGVHAIGSLGAVHYISHHLPNLYATVGEAEFSGVIRSTFTETTIQNSEVACPLQLHS